MPEPPRYRRIHAGAPELQRLAREGVQLGEIVFLRTVEADPLGGAAAAHEPIDADDAEFEIVVGAIPIDQEQMVEIGIEPVAFAPVARVGLIGGGAHLFDEDAVAQPLGGSDFLGIPCQTNREAAGFDLHVPLGPFSAS